MSKHTPGPWTYVEESECVVAEPGNIIGRFEPVSGPLAAAAPDLLEALQELIAMDEAQVFVKDPWDASFAKAKAAVAKASGAS